MWIVTTMGWLAARSLRSFSSQASCAAPRLPSPPGFSAATFTRATKCTPLASKLYQPPGLAASGAKRAKNGAPLSTSMSCSPGMKWVSIPVALTRSCAVSHSLSRDRWLTSPVWSMKSGRSFIAATRSSSALKVWVASGLAPLLKPICESLICTKLSDVFASVAACALPSSDARGTPPLTVHSTPAPAHSPHSSARRRLIPLVSSGITSLLLVAIQRQRPAQQGVYSTGTGPPSHLLYLVRGLAEHVLSPNYSAAILARPRAGPRGLSENGGFQC